jgi:hypothetical protein
VPWRTLTDPENIENRNAGNGGDLGKHTVYLAVLEYLLQHQPWSTGLRARECHAGRGMYEIPAGDSSRRRPLLERLYEPLDAQVGVPLHDVQQGSQRALRTWPEEPGAFAWYSGSAVVNAWCLGNAARGEHLLELYELAPATRAILRAVFADPGLDLPRATVRVLPEIEDGREFDGEAYMEQNVASWAAQDVILLDPFAIWWRPRYQRHRGRYRRILDQLLGLPEPPQLLWFWTWGRALAVAKGDIAGTSTPALNGYQDLRQALHGAGRRFIRIAWRCGLLQFAMWVVVPPHHLAPLAEGLRVRCDQVRDHLLRGRTSRLGRPSIEVVVD